MTKKKKEKQNKFKEIYRRFKREIKLHEKSIEVIGSYAYKSDKKILKKLESILDKAKDKRLNLSVTDIEVLMEVYNEHPDQSFLFRKNTIVSIVSLLDDVFSSIFRDYYLQNPDKLSLENQSINYTELGHVSKINEAKNYLINKEIEAILIKQGIKSRFEILKNEMDVSIPDNNEHLLEVNKLIKTRNLIVHNSCCIDQEYSKKYGDEKLKKGDRIPLSEQYLKNTLSLVFYIGSYILQSVQLKQFSKKLESNDFILNDVMHELVKKENYTFLKEMYNFAKDSDLDDINKKMIVINFCIGLKKQGKSLSHIDKVLEQEDWSVEEPTIELCLSALKEDHDDFYSKLETLIKNKKISKRELLDWEIFSLYRRKTKFRKIVKKVIE
ncbi:MAG: hypothetical protein WD552_02635 [Candidatus Paceibacterota bacterium]